MTTYRSAAQLHKPAHTESKNQTLFLVLALIALLASGGLVLNRMMATRAEEAKSMEARNPETQIQQIRNNPKMPPQAKAIAEAQIRARLQESATRAAAQKR